MLTIILILFPLALSLITLLLKKEKTIGTLSWQVRSPSSA